MARGDAADTASSARKQLTDIDNEDANETYHQPRRAARHGADGSGRVGADGWGTGRFGRRPLAARKDGAMGRECARPADRRGRAVVGGDLSGGVLLGAHGACRGHNAGVAAQRRPFAPAHHHRAHGARVDQADVRDSGRCRHLSVGAHQHRRQGRILLSARRLLRHRQRLQVGADRIHDSQIFADGRRAGRRGALPARGSDGRHLLC